MQPFELTPSEAQREHAELVDHLRALLRLRTVNPPGDETVAAEYLRDVLAGAGMAHELVEPFPGRGNVFAQLRGDGTGGGPLLLLSHTDVVPVEEERWEHDPFGAEVDGGYVYGRGAVDMKGMLAMELAVMLHLARKARAAGADPAGDPVPGLRRDVIFAATADEEAGGFNGAGWLVEHRPSLLRADAALNEAGAVRVDVLGRRFYPIGVAEKGFVVYRITVHGTPGHGSMPRDDNAAVLAARVVERLAQQGATRVTELMDGAIRSVAAHLPDETGHRVHHLLHPIARVSDSAIDALCDPSYARAMRALLRDTVSPDVVRAGVKYNVIPGRAEIEVDCRTLPGTNPEEMTERLCERIGEDLLAHCEVRVVASGIPLEQPTDTALYPILGEVLRAHDPDAIPIPIMAPFATDAKHLHRLGIPTYGFSPLGLEPGERFLELFHGDDERVSLDALRFGYPVLLDVVRRYCA